MGLSIQDKIEITELESKFCEYSDYGNWEALKELYTEDAGMTLEGGGNPIGSYKGIEWHIEHAKQSATMTGGQNRHALVNLWIEPDPDNPNGAIAHFYYINYITGTKPMEPKIVTTAHQADKVVRTDRGWRIAYRHFMGDQSFDIKQMEE